MHLTLCVCFPLLPPLATPQQPPLARPNSPVDHQREKRGPAVAASGSKSAERRATNVSNLLANHG